MVASGRPLAVTPKVVLAADPGFRAQKKPTTTDGRQRAWRFSQDEAGRLTGDMDDNEEG
jgi:hypothetical protein